MEQDSKFFLPAKSKILFFHLFVFTHYGFRLGYRIVLSQFSENNTFCSAIKKNMRAKMRKMLYSELQSQNSWIGKGNSVAIGPGFDFESAFRFGQITRI